MTRQDLEVDVHRDASGYWAQVVGMEGCFASGQTLDELTSALTEALQIYLGENEEVQRLLVQVVCFAWRSSPTIAPTQALNRRRPRRAPASPTEVSVCPPEHAPDAATETWSR